MNVVFLGAKSVGLSCLDILIKNQHTIGYKVLGVILGSPRNKNDALFNVGHLAEKNKIPIYKSIEEILVPIDYLISVQYDRVLTERELNLVNKRCVNLHLAPLPEYRGANQFSFAIINKERFFGVTLHEMNPIVDSGNIIAESRFPIPDQCTAYQLKELSIEKGLFLFKNSLKLIFSDINSMPQGNKKFFYKKSDINSVKKLDLRWPKEKLARYVRALSMPGFEPPYIIINHQKIYLSLTWQ